MTTLVYTEEEFKVMVPVYKKLQSIKNTTELNACKKALHSFVKLMESLKDTKLLDNKPFKILCVGEHLIVEKFPVVPFYTINIED